VVDLVFTGKTSLKPERGVLKAALTTAETHKEDRVKLAKEGACMLSALRGKSEDQIIPLLHAVGTCHSHYCCNTLLQFTLF
jgi:hypothetical protein